MSRRTVPLLTLIAPLALAACTPPGPAPLDTVVAGDAGPVTVSRIQGSGERSPTPSPGSRPVTTCASPAR